MKYINDNIEYGLEYDWDKINKKFKSLKIPKDVYNPSKLDFTVSKYFLLLSERSIGKTTNVILYGMCMYILYGTVIQYVRQKPESIEPRNVRDLFDTILANDYITKLTDGKYNSVTLKAKRWYLCKIDTDGKIVEIDNNHFMFMCAVLKGEDLKSSYNAPTGDFIVYDECINTYYYPNEFVLFCDLVKTIIRERRSPIIIMLANTIDKHSEYFNELGIYEQVQTLFQGQNMTIKNPTGTTVYVEIIGKTIEKAQKRSVLNALFFGFKNPKLASITGADWAIKNYQHIPSFEIEYLSRRIYIYHNDRYISLDIVKSEELGYCVYVHWATKTYPDSIILTLDDRYDSRYIYKLGSGRLGKMLNHLYKENRFYYATNDVGAFFDNYLKLCSKTT